MALTLGPPTWATGSWATDAWADDTWDVDVDAEEESTVSGSRRIPHCHGRGKHAHYLSPRIAASEPGLGLEGGGGLLLEDGGRIELEE